MRMEALSFLFKKTREGSEGVSEKACKVEKTILIIKKGGVGGLRGMIVIDSNKKYFV